MSRPHEPETAGERVSMAADGSGRVRVSGPAPRMEEVAARAGQSQRMAAEARGASGRTVVAATAPAATLPARFDLRDVNGRDFVTAVRDQGDADTGAAFAVLAALETTAAYTRGVPSLTLDLSEAHLLQGNAHAPVEELFDHVASEGVTFEDYFPYADRESGAPNPDWPNRMAKAVGVTDLTGDPAAIKQHLFSYGALAARLIVHEDFPAHGQGVYRATTDVLGSQCVSLIGWDEDSWIIKNSWGTDWGEGGFARIAYGECHIEAYPGGRPSVLGCTSVYLRAWLPAQRALRLFATANDANGWAYLEHLGWTHLSGGPHKLDVLTRAQATGRPVTPFVNGDELSTVRVAE
ncbi:C1 family peptidase [Actinocrispum sp. NPDC049592]|uniref:C1 family peptidase n=1 Tax=Actinocrispum sp. NPDC049592 TaxID=3154835 RepID=UPI0034348D14